MSTRGIAARYTHRRSDRDARPTIHCTAGRPVSSVSSAVVCFDTETTMGALLRLVLALLIVAVIVGFFMGYRIRAGRTIDPSGAAATAGKVTDVDPAKAREAGA